MSPSARCPVCSSERSLPFGERDGYVIRRCRRCDHIAVVNMPSPAELDRVYARYSYEDRHLGSIPPFVFEVLAGVVRTYEPHRRTGRILDVGFGAGALLAAAKRAGWETHGIETSSLAVQQARENALGSVRHGDFLAEPYPTASFDVVAMDGVIEHLLQPGAFLRRARELLTPGGLLYVTVPHGRGFSARVLGADWSVCAPPEHLHLFSLPSMRWLLRAEGFNTHRILTKGINPHEIVRRFRPRREERFDRVATSYALNARVTGSRGGRFLKTALNRALDAARLGDNIVAYGLRP